MTFRMLLVLSVTLAGGCRSDARGGAPSVVGADARPLAEVRRVGNHLLNAGSAYLRQHAHNPVDWFPWGPEALALSSRLDRPIFLSIGYVSCHWCHVMEQEVFEKDDVAAFLNEHFVSIKVDREERPDLDAVYMQAVEAMTGSGGWPMTLFLTPSLRPFFGGTYLPHDAFLEVVRRASEQFRTARSAVETRGEEVHRAIAVQARESDAVVKADDLRALAKRAVAEIDPTWGGFRGRTKFPTPVRFRFLLHAYRKWGDSDVLAALRKTLDAIDEGGIHDHVSGGFFRYATEPTWTIPHFEKMLYDNAQLAALYLEASAALGDARYAAVGLDTLDFMMREMQNQGRAFGASFDADSGGKEGAFYLFTRDELVAALGETDAVRFADRLGVTKDGNFEHQNVLTRRVREGEPRLAASDAEWERVRQKLGEARRKKQAPSYDAKSVTAWNGLAISALSLGYRASGERRFLDAAASAAEAVWKQNRRESGELARASNDGRATERAVLDDYAELALAFIDLFEVTTNPMHLERAIMLVDEARDFFSNPGGGWFLTSRTEAEPLGRRIELVDSVEPSGNSAMILAHLRLASLTGRFELGIAADLALRANSRAMQGRALEMMGWLDDALLAAGPFYEVVVAGDEDLDATRKLYGVVNRLLPPWVTSVRLPATGPTDEIARWTPPSVGKRAANGKALGFVCKMGSCKAPRTDPARLQADLVEGWAH